MVQTESHESHDVGASSATVIIHVVDDHRKINRDFVCEKEILLNEMKYFNEFMLQSSTPPSSSQLQSKEEIDISVHCDVKVFSWLVKYMTNKNRPPKLTVKMLPSILVSSRFLLMDRLVQRCVYFISEHLSDIAALPIDLACLDKDVLNKLAMTCTPTALYAFKDTKNKFKSKLLQTCVDVFLKTYRNSLRKCRMCHAVYLTEHQKKLHCYQSTEFDIDFHGELVCHHAPKRNWKVDDYIQDMQTFFGDDDQALYFHYLGLYRSFDCKKCGKHFNGLQINQCYYHPKEPHIHEADENKMATYSCCQVPMFAFDFNHAKGCQQTTHDPVVSEKDDFDSNLYEIFKSYERRRLRSKDNLRDCNLNFVARINEDDEDREKTSGVFSFGKSDSIHGDERRKFLANMCGDYISLKEEISSQEQCAGENTLDLEFFRANTPRRKQWHMFQQQENDRMRMQDLCTRLMRTRINS